MAKTYHNSNQWALAGLFKRMNLGEDLKQIQSEASHLKEIVGTGDIAAAQQILINEGLSPYVVEKISAAFMLMGLRKKNIEPIESRLPENHILRKIFAEHAMVRCYVADLVQISRQIETLDHLKDVSSEFRRLCQIVEYFIQVKKQIERENDLIFPYLKKFGWAGLCRSAQDEHDHIKIEIDNLIILVTGFNTISIKDFNTWLPLVVSRFCPLMLNHLSYEREVLWPIALVVINDVNIWEAIGLLSNEIGY